MDHPDTDTDQYLELLEREAPAVEFDRPILHARAAGASPETLADLERARQRALRVRANLTQRARRGAELSALFDIAGNLAGLRDLDSILTAIVRHARQLLGADTAYMTLRDDTHGDNFMRVTDGSASAMFRKVRLPDGIGLGGLVAQTAIPYASADYFNDDRFVHSHDVDSSVQDEGLVAILGTPLQAGHRVIGVLFAADRRVRHFSADQVALLGSLAAHAGIAIDNAQLLEKTQAALEQLSTANASARAHSEAVERAAHAHDRMADLVLRGGGIEDLAAMVAEVLDGSLAVLDSTNRETATVGDVGTLTPEVFESARDSRSQGRSVRIGELSVASLEVGGEPLCTLVLRTSAELSGSDQRILERAALVAALLTLFRRSEADAAERFRGELLDDLIDHPGSDPASLIERARRVGVDLDAPHIVICVRHNSPRQRVAFAAAPHATLYKGLSTVRGREAVLLLPGTNPGNAARRIAHELTHALDSPATAGAAGPIHGPQHIHTAHREARRCADTLIALGRKGSGTSHTELGFVGLLTGEQADITEFITTTIGPVLDYDTRRGTALTDTLQAYYDNSASPARAANALHVHANTVSQRLERVARLLGDDWQQPDRALDIQLALRLHRIADAT